MANHGLATRSVLLLVIVVLVACLGVVAVRLLWDISSSSVSSVKTPPLDPCETISVAAMPTSRADEATDDSSEPRESELTDSESVTEEPIRAHSLQSGSMAPRQDAPVPAKPFVPLDKVAEGMIRGVLVDVEGNPVEGYVTLEHVATEPNRAAASSFAIPMPDHQRPGGLLGCARDVSGTLGRRFLWPQGDPNEELVLVLEPYGSVMGHVVGVDRKPVAGVRLDLQTQMLDNTWRGGDVGLETPTVDDAGYFLFDRVPVGLKVKVTAHRGTQNGQSRRILLRSGETADAGEIRMMGLRPGEGTVQGRITDETGRPLSDRSIRMRLGRNAQWVRTDAGGYFVITDLPKERALTVTVEVDGYGSWSRKVVPDDFNCDFRLCPPGWDVVGKEALPLFAGKWFNHAPMTVEQLRGRVVLLAFRNFERDIDPGLARIRNLQNEFGPRGLLIVAIYNYLPGSSPLAEDIVTGHLLGLFQGAPIAGLLDADPALVADLMPVERPAGAGAGATHWMYQVHTRPAFFLIDKAGTVRHCTGSDAELRDWIDRLVDE